MKVTNKDILLLSCPVVTVILPIILVYAVGGYTGLAFMIICLLIVNPAYFIVMGTVCGSNIKRYWPVPFVSVVITSLSLKFILQMGIADNHYYAVIYLVCSVLPMILTAIIKCNKQNGEPHKNRKLLITVIGVLIFLMSICAVMLVLK